ncbi:MAG TPA: ATP phosphoribosyltransferase [Firmicutes bacterium]|nr:ATP phosphoribosyltransferase [Bacillota bacterium]
MLKLVLPTGSLEKPTLEMFEDAQLSVHCYNSRCYDGEIDDPRIKRVRFMRPQEIPLYVAEGLFDLGITGLDWIMERDCEDQVEIITHLPYSRATAHPVRIVVAVHENSGIDRVEDIPPGSRVTTEYVNLAKRYFKQKGIDVQVEFSFGTTEAKVPEIADVAVELTERGTTLKANGLKIIDVIAQSKTTLIANPESMKDPEKKLAIQEITTLLQGALMARGRVLLKMNVAKSNLKRVLSLLPSMKAPTVSQLYSETDDYVAVETVVDREGINLLLPKLVAAGAEDILEIPITKIVG